MGRALTVLDAAALVAQLTGEPAQEPVDELLRDDTTRCAISATNLSELIDVLVRVKRRTRDEVLERVSWLKAGGLVVVPADEYIGRLAGALRANHYHHEDRPLSLGDCTALAAAAALGEPLATSDGALAATARDETVEVVALPDSTGSLP